MRQKRAAHDKRAADLRAAVEEQLAVELAELETEIEGLREDSQNELDGIDDVNARALEGLDKRTAALASDREQLAELRGQADAAVKARALEELAEDHERKAKEHGALSAELTVVLEQLDAFGRQLASDLPIEGLEIDGKEIRVYDVPYDQLNHAQRVEIAAKVAMLRARENPLRVVFLDGLESLDSAHREALLELLVREGVQPFGAVVTDDDREVRYYGAVSQEALSA